MPELAAFFIVGATANLALTGLFAFLWKRRYTTGLYRELGLNLRKAGMYWSVNQERVVTGPTELEDADRARSLKMILLTGALLTLLSWAGLVFQLVIMLSYRYLSRSRLEKALVASPLALDPTLSPQEARRLVEVLR